MRLPFCGVLAFACVLLASACDSDSKDSSPTGATAGAGGDGAEPVTGNGGSAGDPAPGDACHEGCVATLLAACSNGPADQASCESTCHALEMGKCGGEYTSFQNCADGKAVSCGTGALDGLPVVEGCSDEQTAFIACING